MIEVPGQPDFHFDFGFPPRMAYACMAETMALALEGRYTDYTIGKDITYVDPKNENRIYDIHSTVTYSEDAGKSFSTMLPYFGIHPDHHAWWIHPEDANLIIEGNDGGIGISRDRGKSGL